MQLLKKLQARQNELFKAFYCVSFFIFLSSWLRSLIATATHVPNPHIPQFRLVPLTSALSNGVSKGGGLKKWNKTKVLRYTRA